MLNYEFQMDKNCIIQGRKGLKIMFDRKFPEEILCDKSLFGLNDKELKETLKKPFVTTSDLNVKIEYKNEDYEFKIPKGYDWNGANVPFCCWLIIGQQKEPRFKLASCVHDYLCENKQVINNNRYLSTLIFETLCEYFGGFNAVKRWVMFHCVDNYQKIIWKKSAQKQDTK